MKRQNVVRLLVVLIGFVLVVPTTHAHAAGEPQFVVGAGGIFLRPQPMLTAPSTEPVFAQDSFPVVARSANNIWLKVQTPKGDGWLLTQYGQLNGELSALPTEKPVSNTVGGTMPWSQFITPITARAKKLYLAKAANKNLNAFTVVGDCNSVPEAYVGRVAMGLFDASKYPALAPAVERFAPSFGRLSQAAFRGFNSASMFDPVWANPNFCEPGEGVLACELRRSQASVVFISLGTGDQFTWKDFEKNYRGVLDYVVQQKRLPVLVTKADDLELQQGSAPAGTINAAIRKLGAEYGVPVIDFYAATRGLPDYGLRWEGNENFHMSAAGSDTRILLSLQVLDALNKK